MAREAPNLQKFADELRAEGFTHAVLLGMGGSSLAPDVLRHTFGSAQGYPELHVLDTTDSTTIKSVEDGIDLSKTLFIVASKSGTTIETVSQFRYFWEKVNSLGVSDPGKHFIAITDPGTKLAEEGRSKGFRAVFENREDIGGRYSAMSYFGLVPGAIIGAPIDKLLDRAQDMAKACGPDVAPQENPGIWLGTIMGEMALAGRDKLTLVISPGIGTFGYWVEQLIAESTGKEGKGILPVEGETLGEPSSYGDDRLFVHLDMGSPEDKEMGQKLERLAQSGHPVVTLRLAGPTDMGGEFLRWEIATAIAGAILGINPFDEPNVQESKDNTNRLLREYENTGKLPEPEPDITEGSISLYGYQGHTLAGALEAFLSSAKAGDYLALMAYVPYDPEVEKPLQEARIQLRDALRIATTFGYGPRFLHSTGQLHKGGADNGIFLQVTYDEPQDIPIPGVPYSFNVLKRAQALGDFEALKGRGRRVLRVHLQGELYQALTQLQSVVQDAIKVRS